jgi:hypothetical protein
VSPSVVCTANAIFELFNEPGGRHTQADWTSFKSVADGWVSLIRNAAPDNLIFVGAPSYSQNLTYVPQAPINGTNIVYVAHIYPQHAQSNWDTWFGNTANSYPVFLTEWGFQQGAPSPCNGTETSFGNPFKNYVNGKDNLRWSAWNFDHVWYPLTWDSSWNLRTGPAYHGQFVKTWIAEKLQ